MSDRTGLAWIARVSAGGLSGVRRARLAGRFGRRRRLARPCYRCIGKRQASARYKGYKGRGRVFGAGVAAALGWLSLGQGSGMGADPQFWLALLQIIGVNILLSGDNAVVIALACRGLPARQQKLGIAFGASAAVVLRILLTLFIVYLLTIPYLNLVGGLLLLWIGYRLMAPEEDGADVDPASSLWAAVRIVVIADAVMSLDNVIAVAAAARGNILLLVLGLIISVPLVVYGATLLLAMIKRFPAIVPAGAALIAYVGAEIAIADPALAPWVAAHADWLGDGLPLLAAVAVVLLGRLPARPEARGPIEDASLAGPLARRRIAGRAPLVLASLASLFCYALDSEVMELAAMRGAMPVLHAARPILAAVIAIGLCELACWLMAPRPLRS